LALTEKKRKDRGSKSRKLAEKKTLKKEKKNMDLVNQTKKDQNVLPQKKTPTPKAKKKKKRKKGGTGLNYDRTDTKPPKKKRGQKDRPHNVR